MSLAQKLILYALAVALIPLAATGFTLIRVGEGALRQRIQEHQQAAAIAVAAKVSQAVEDLTSRLSTVMEVVDVLDLTVPEREGLLHLLYRQSDDASVVVLLDSDSNLLAPPVYITNDNPGAAQLAAHPRASDADVQRFLDHLPAQGDKGASVLMSPVYFPAGGEARVAVSIPCCNDADGRPRARAGVEIALRPDTLKVEGIETGAQSAVFVVDQRGRVIMHPTVPAGTNMAHYGDVAAALKRGGRGTLRFAGAGEVRAAAFAPVGKLGWKVVVEQPEAVAFRAAHRMRRQTLAWIAATTLLVLLSGLLFAGHQRRLLRRLVDGARAFGAGRLAERIQVRSGDEIGELAHTMNGMAGDLARSLGELEQWSRTLETRVEERTAELKQAQAQLLMQSKLAAIGQLGAGVAHEVNNPLAGILGYTQLLMRRHPDGDPDFGSLVKIEEAARRCKEITINLLRFSERGLAGRSEMAVNDVVQQVIEVVEGGLVEGKIELDLQLADGLPKIVADSGQVALVLLNIVNNARNAMPEGGRLRVATAAEDDGVQITVNDSGHGIAPEHLPRIFEPFYTTKTVWTASGLGLSVAYRIVSDHGGRIDVDSEVGQGATFCIYLPIQPPPLETPSVGTVRPTLA